MRIFPVVLSRMAPRSYHTDHSSQQTDDRIYPVYIHHVSKIALQHLQDTKSEWLAEQGLDRGLHVNANGTFTLNFPTRKGFDAGKIWSVLTFA
jgi:hypothetical protein